MATEKTQMEKLALEQLKTYSQIKQEFENYRKYGTRRHTKYVEEKIISIQTLWATFVHGNTEITKIAVDHQDHEYFTKRFSANAKKTYEQYLEIMQAELKGLTGLQGSSSEINIAASVEVEDVAPEQQVADKKRSCSMFEISFITSDQEKRYRKQYNRATEIQNICDVVRNTVGLTETSLRHKLKRLEDYWQRFENEHEEINSVKTAEDEDEVYHFNSVYAEIRDWYETTVEFIQQKLLSMRPTVSTVNREHNGPDIKLPRIDLPKFGGSFTAWPSFKESFTKMVIEMPISDANKLQYLKTAVTGNALSIIRHLDILDVNFDIAWKLIQDRYNNERLLINKQIETLCQQQAVGSDALTGLRRIHDTTRECVYTLEKMGIDIVASGPFIVYHIYQKLDRDTIVAFEQSLKNPNKLQTLEKLLSFMDQRFQTLDVIKQKGESSKRHHIGNSGGATYRSHATESNFGKCIVCKGLHKLYRCPEFLEMPVIKRFELVKKHKYCYKCLCLHETKCFAQFGCKTCGGNHNTLLHFQGTKIRPASAHTITENKLESKVEQKLDVSTLHVDNQNHAKSVNVLLATAQVLVKSGFGTFEPLRALIDQGSQTSFITTQAANKLNLKIRRTNATVSGLGATTSGVVRGQVTMHLVPRFESTFQLHINALVLKQLTNSLPGFKVKNNESSVLQGLQLADPAFNEPGKIDILLGADIYEDIILHGLIKGVRGMPMAQETELGWMLSGKTACNQTENIMALVSNMELDQQLARFWEIEEVSAERMLTAEEEACEKHYAENHDRRPDGKYVVKLPLKEDPKVLGNSFNMAMVRFKAMERSLAKNPALRAEYVKFMDEYEQLGHMVVAEPEFKKSTYYLPHHAVVKPSSTTTKVRVVFDASAKTNSGKSLNDLQMVGPRIQQELVSILLRWRIHRIVFTADVAKMYRQIMVNEKDQDLQRIIWRKDPSEQIKHYKLKTITYGTASAPFLAIRTLKQLALDEKANYSLGSEILLRDFYVDDLMSGANSVEKAINAQNEVIQILRAGGLPIRKWTSNHEKLLLNVPESDREISLPLNFELENTVKTLGVLWSPGSDEFKYRVIISNQDTVTKRQLVSEIAKIFDPVGWLAPVVVTAKMLYQKLWLMGLDWDENLPEATSSEWKNYQKLLPLVEKIRIPRWIRSDTDLDEIELHGFCDASIRAYAAVVFVRIKQKDRFHTQLLTSKTRVAPTAQISLPRLELKGAHLLANLLVTTKKSLGVSDNQIYAWCDSTITLSWIHGQSSRWKTFVANRVSQIQGLIGPNKWKYVNTKENPADIASRGCQPDELEMNKIWWSGPEWLAGHDSTWPIQPPAMDFLTTEEMKKQEVKTICVNVRNLDDLSLYIEKYSTLTKLIRVTAYCTRFINNYVKILPTSGCLNTMELNASLYLWIRKSQMRWFPVEYSILTNKKTLVKSKLISLAPFLDEHGVMRVGGRLDNANLPYQHRHPAILAGNDHLTMLIVRDAHQKTLHGGIKLTMAKLRLQYWIISGKSAVKYIINKCVTCFRFRSNGHTQIMGHLPEPRITMSRPFCHVGVDFAGPLSIKISPGRGTRTTKGYVCVFICLATRAIHLEPVSELSTQAFLAALRRFSGRRGVSSHIYSDCGTNFVGASRKLKNEYDEWVSYLNDDVKDVLASTGTQWHFIPPGSPNFGGLWEAGVKSMKHHFKRMVNYNLTFEELTTVLCQIEGCLNSRPLCEITNDPNDLTVLTPGHFLVGEAILSVPGPDLLDENVNRLTRWKLLQRLQQEFWKNWNSEYLARLQQRPKWKKQTKNLEIGNMVLIRDEQLPPARWLLGRVIKTHPGKDGLIRVVTLKNKNTILKRPISKICLLPIEDNESPAILKSTVAILEPQTPVSISDKNGTNKLYGVNRKNKINKMNGGTLFNIILYCFTMFNMMFGAIATSYFNGNLELTPMTTQSGIYFEDIGKVNLLADTWQLIVYYDLENYWSEQTMYKECLKKLNEGCKREKTGHTYGESQPGILSDPDKLACITIHDKLKSMVEEIFRRNEILYHGNQDRVKKIKRSPFNVVGNIQHALFGVLDEDFARKYEQNIESIHNNEERLHALLMNQTSIAEMTVNIIRKNSNDILAISNEFSNQLEEMSNNEKAHASFMAAAFNLMLHIITYQQTQNALIDLVLDTQHGKINPLLLSPEQFIKQITVIQEHIPVSVKIPGYRAGENLSTLYKLISTRARVLESKIIIELSIPLINMEQFQLFNLVSIPTTQHNHSVVLTPSTKYLAITLDRSKYWVMDEFAFQRCISQGEKKYFCKSNQPVYTSNSKVAECEVNLLSHRKEFAKSCRIMITTEPQTISWVKLKAGNTWIVHAPAPQSVDVICNDKLQSILLNGTIKLELFNSCQIKHASTIIHAHEVYSSGLNSSFNPTLNVHEVVNSGHINRTQNDVNIRKSSFTELGDLDKYIHQQKGETQKTLNNISQHDVHQFIMLYAIIIIIIVGGVWFAFIKYKHLCGKCKSDKKPVPAKRADTSGSSPFEISLETISGH